jgi:xanthosine utilization system XapX-like protein
MKSFFFSVGLGVGIGIVYGLSIIKIIVEATTVLPIPK